MTRGQGSIAHSNAKKGFSFLFLTAWVCVGALLKWDAQWIYLLLGLTVIAGLWVGRRQPALPRVPLLLLALAVPVWKGMDRWRDRATPRAHAAVVGEKVTALADDSAVISALVTTEETILKLTPKMSALSRGLLDLRLPGPGAEAETVFARSASVSDIGPAPALSPTPGGMTESRTWPVAESAKETARVDLWRPMLDAVSWFEHAKVYLIDGHHPNGDSHRYEATGGFDALARMKAGEWRSLHGKLKLTWQRAKATAGEPEPGWQISG